jgi:hypothetical protein
VLIALVPGVAFVADASDAVSAGRIWHDVVSAYPLTGHGPRWSTRLPAVVNFPRTPWCV